MAHTLPLWLKRSLVADRPVILAAATEPAPMKIEVERLPDHLWRELGFPLPRLARE